MAFFSCLSCFHPVRGRHHHYHHHHHPHRRKRSEERKRVNDDNNDNLCQNSDDVSELDLAHCSLDDVPHQIFALERTLERLNLECNNIAALPRSLFHCHGLKYLSIADNDLHSLPDAISSLAQLTELNVSKNVLTDIPDGIKQCKALRRLDLSVNPLQKIPEGCTQLLSVTELYLNDTFLEFLPANFGRLAKLKILELRENSLTTLPKSLSRLVNLERLDLGQNDVSEIPEVIGSLTGLKELWMDGNRIKVLPPFLGNLSELVHLDVSLNHLERISTDSMLGCKRLVDFSASGNDLKTIPESLCELRRLITLKLDDNELQELPSNLGSLKNVEELFLSQNELRELPPSIGLCRRLHTLNIDDNDIEFLPEELGSCIELRILSAHGNRLTTLPAELDHISNLSVINVTANMIQHLPLSFMKLTKINALWLSENQNKPLIQLNQDNDPITGQRVLTNFLLPQTLQHHEPFPYTSPSAAATTTTTTTSANATTKTNNTSIPDNLSESGSFRAWEEERLAKSMVKWANSPSFSASSPFVDGENRSGNFQREPTPFPKEMRAMAKRAQNLRTAVKAHHNSAKKICEIPQNNNNNNINGDKSCKEKDDEDCRDSGVVSEISPSIESCNGIDESQRKPSDPLPSAPGVSSPVKAEIVTNDVDANNDNENDVHKRPPPYHIAAALSKRAMAFNRHCDDVVKECKYENQSVIFERQRHRPIQLERNSSFLSDKDEGGSVSDLSDASTAQTIVHQTIHDAEIASDAESIQTHANKLRQVSEQLLSSSPGVVPGSLRSSFNRSNFVFGNNHRSNSQIIQTPASFVVSPANTVGLPQPEESPSTNGLLSTIDKVGRADSDEEIPPPGFAQGILRPPGTTLSRIPPLLHQQPNYENVKLGDQNGSPSVIPLNNDSSSSSTSSSTKRISTSSQYVSSARKSHISKPAQDSCEVIKKTIPQSSLYHKY